MTYKYSTLIAILVLTTLPAISNAQMSFTSDDLVLDEEPSIETMQDTSTLSTSSSSKSTILESSRSSTQSTESSSSKKYFSTDENEIVLYRDGKKVKSLPLHSASNSTDQEDLPMASIPSNINISNDDFAIVVSADGSNNASGSTVVASGSIVPEVVVGEAEANSGVSSGGSSALPLIAIGVIAVIAGAVVGLKFLKSKKV